MTTTNLRTELEKQETRLTDELMGDLASIKRKAATLVERALKVSEQVAALKSDPRSLLGAPHMAANLATNLAHEFEVLAKGLECLQATAECAHEIQEILS